MTKNTQDNPLRMLRNSAILALIVLIAIFFAAKTASAQTEPVEKIIFGSPMYVVEEGLPPTPNGPEIDTNIYREIARLHGTFANYFLLSSEEDPAEVQIEGMSKAVANGAKLFDTELSVNFGNCKLYLMSEDGSMRFPWYRIATIMGHLSDYSEITPNYEYWVQYGLWGFDVGATSSRPEQTFLFRMGNDFSCTLAGHGTLGNVRDLSNPYLHQSVNTILLNSVPR